MVYRNRSQTGFTLVEMMIVVAIVAILALLGMVGYRKIISSSHSAEARQMLGAIRIAQESRRAETGSFATPSPGGYGALCPSNGVGDKKTGWNPACGAWSQLPVHSDGPVRYGYSSISGRSGIAVANVPNQASDYPALVWPASPAADWFVAYARLDENSNGTFASAISSSFTNEIWVANEGE